MTSVWRFCESGSVLAIDLNLTWIQSNLPHQVELRCHDVTSDEIPTETYDLIHARLVLGHLPQRDRVIERLVAALAPGGWLVLEEFDEVVRGCREPTSHQQRTFNRALDAFSELLVRRGRDAAVYPRTLPWKLQRAGLCQAGAAGQVIFATGASPGAAVLRANLRHYAVDAELISADDVTTVLRLLDDQSSSSPCRSSCLHGDGGKAS